MYTLYFGALSLRNGYSFFAGMLDFDADLSKKELFVILFNKAVNLFPISLRVVYT